MEKEICNHEFMSIGDWVDGKVEMCPKCHAINFSSVKQFPNGFQSWAETYYNVVELITMLIIINRHKKSKIETDCRKRLLHIRDTEGHPELQILASEITECFEKENKGREWDGEWSEELYEYALDYIFKQ